MSSNQMKEQQMMISDQTIMIPAEEKDWHNGVNNAMHAAHSWAIVSGKRTPGYFLISAYKQVSTNIWL